MIAAMDAKIRRQLNAKQKAKLRTGGKSLHKGTGTWATFPLFFFFHIVVTTSFQDEALSPPSQPSITEC